MYYERGRGGSRAFKSNQGQSAHRQRIHQGSRKWSSKLCTSWFWSSIIVYLQVVVLQIVGLLVLVLKIVHLLVLILKIVHLLAELWSSKLCTSWFWSSIIVYLQVVVLQIVRAPSGPQNCEPLQVVVLQIKGLLVLILKIVRLLAELWSSKLCAYTPGCGRLNQVLHMLAL